MTDGLNLAQWAAVRHLDSPLLVLASCYSSTNTKRFPRAAAARSSVLSEGQWLASSKRRAAGHEVSSARAKSAKVRSPRAKRKRSF